VLTLLACACEQLGNPPQYATAPTPWKDARGHLVTTTRSFKNEKTIRRIVAEGMDELDYSDPSIGPSQTLTLVQVIPRAFRPTRAASIDLVTRFELRGSRVLNRAWRAPSSKRKWSAAFALPEPPINAITAVAP
jgi:hypothetical protein